MSISRFFIDRPIFAWVIAILVMLAGVISIATLPVEQYPDIAAPTVNIGASYPGASAETIENSVTQVIEQAMTGLDHLRYFTASSDVSGNASVTLTFEPEADPDIAQMQVQNKIQRAMPLLPIPVQEQGVRVNKSSGGFILAAGFYAEDGQSTQYQISDFLNSKMIDPISRINGVGEVTVFGDPFAMRIWLDPNKMNSYSITSNDVITAVRAQNVDVSAGQLGGTPSVSGQQINATIKAQSRLQTPEQFADIILRVNTNGSQVRLKDVARVELGMQSYDRVSRYKGHPAAGLAVSLSTGANALKTADAVKQKIKEMEPLLPPGVKVSYPYDMTPFVRLAIHDVVKTLGEAVILVFLVMFLFLQSFRATIIPTIAVPVVLLGTFGILAACGFTINVLTMFAVVLAIGLLVDDAIVVVENVERVMHEEGLDPKEATRKSMDEITSALIGIGMTLSAVFVPMAFFPGSTGAIYRQFSITIVSAMGLSVITALILTPALCATILKRQDEHERRGFFGWFNRNFERGRDAYERAATFITHRAFRAMIVYALIVTTLIILFPRIPTSFLPNEDQGLMFLQIGTPPGSTSERTLQDVKKVEKYFLENEKDSVKGIFTVVGFSFAGKAQNAAFGFVEMRDWAERQGKGQGVMDVSKRAMGALSVLKDASVYAITPPPIRALGNASGFDVQLLDTGGKGHDALVAARNQLLGMAMQDKRLMGVRPNGLEDVPQYKIDIDQEKANALGVSIADINATLQTAWGSTYVNDFINQGRVKRVYVQADAPFRMMPNDLNKWYVRNSMGEMVPFSSFATGHWTYGPLKLERFNGTASVNIQGQPAEGVSSGQAMQIMSELVKKLPQGFTLAWTGLSYEERLAGSQTMLLYALSLLIVFLALAALYESWAIPFGVMMAVPIGVTGAAAATYFLHQENNVFFQVALLTTIGLASKNAILIIEFAKMQYDKGVDIYEAATHAARTRLRPIIMTSMAFVLGVLPLALSHGAGSASQNAIGIAVIGGMVTSTFVDIFFTPTFFVLIMDRLRRKKKKDADANEEKIAPLRTAPVVNTPDGATPDLFPEDDFTFDDEEDPLK